MLTPSQPRMILPVSSCGSSCLAARLIGTAKPIPCPRDIAVLMPITLPARSEERAAGVTGVVEGIALDEVVIRAGARPIAPWPIPRPWVTEEPGPNRFPVATTQSPTSSSVAVAQVDVGEVGGGRVDLQQRDVGLGVGADQLGGELAPVGHRDANLLRPFDDVVVGEHEAPLVHDEPRSEALALELALGHLTEELSEELLEGLAARPGRAAPQVLAGVDDDRRRPCDGASSSNTCAAPATCVEELLGSPGWQSHQDAPNESEGT